MQLYSQKDPAYQDLHLGQSKASIRKYGCFLVSLATLYQQHPTELLKVNRAFTSSGDLDSQVVATHCGGDALQRTKKPPKGWCIAVTKYYQSVGYPTHFFLVNMSKGLMIDPLNYPARIETLFRDYTIAEYRQFTETRLDTTEIEKEQHRKRLAEVEKELSGAAGKRMSLLTRLKFRMKARFGL